MSEWVLYIALIAEFIAVLAVAKWAGEKVRKEIVEASRKEEEEHETD